MTMAKYIGYRLAVDADGFVWYVLDNGMFSMARINPDNSPIPHPVTYFDPAEDYNDHEPLT